MVVAATAAAATSVGTCLRERERHTLQSTRAHSARRACACFLFEGESAPLHVACERWSTVRRRARSWARLRWVNDQL